MNYTIDLIENKTILLVTWHQAFTFERDGAALERDIRFTLDTCDHQIDFINDVRAVDVSLDGLIAASNVGARGESPLFSHPNIRFIFNVTRNNTVVLASEGLNSRVFNYTNVSVVESLDRALEIIASHNPSIG